MQSLRPVAPHPDEGHFKEILRLWDQRKIDLPFSPTTGRRDVQNLFVPARTAAGSRFETPFYESATTGASAPTTRSFVAFPLDEDADVAFRFLFPARRSPDEQSAHLASALRGIKWFHSRLVLSHGLLMASSRLTPIERKVLQLLLTDASGEAHRPSGWT